MVRAGMSLPALIQLMGHADIQTTLQYVRITPQDVYLEYARAVQIVERPRLLSCAHRAEPILWLLHLIAPSILSVLHSVPIRLVTTAELSESF